MPLIAGIKRSFSMSFALMMRGDATCAMCVTFSIAVVKAEGVVMSGIWMISRFGEGKESWSLVTEREERTVVRIFGWEGARGAGGGCVGQCGCCRLLRG